MKKKISSFFSKNKSPIILVVLIIFLIYLFIPDLETVKESIALIKQANPTLVLVAIILFFSVIPLNAMQIRVVSDINVKFWLTYKVQMAYQFIGKLLPMSISAYVVNSFYLRRIGHTYSQTVSVIVAKSLSSSIAYLILGATALILALRNLGTLSLSTQVNLSGNINYKIILIFIIGGISIFWVLLKVQKTRNFLNNAISSFWGQFKKYKKRPWDVVLAVVYAFIPTTLQIFTLMVCSFALGMDVNFTQVFVVFTLGNTLAMLVPTPGGVGAAEAGRYAGFTLLGFPASESLAVVTLYRGITFYLPIIPGFIFFVELRKDLFKDFSINTNFIKKIKTAKA
jgi:uncharacterized protein (TIRG00374 family)